MSKKHSASSKNTMDGSKTRKGNGAATKLAKKAGSIADVGLAVASRNLVYIKCDGLNGVLRVINISGEDGVDAIIPPAACVQEALGRTQITGDNKPSHLPVGLGQSSQLRFQVVRINRDLLPGGSRELSPESLDTLSKNQNQQWTMEELMDMIPPLPGSESKKKSHSHYLGYRRSIWRPLQHRKIQEGEIVDKKKTEADIVLDVMNGTFLDMPYKCKPNEEAIVIPEALAKFCVAFVVTKNDSFSHRSNESDKGSGEFHLESFLRSIGTPGCVSLLQKIVRRRPMTLRHPDTCELVEAPRVIVGLVKRLLDPQQPGIFLPDQGLYVSAKQHFVKRLLIIMAEDSKYSEETATLLAISALFLGCEPSWQPPASLQEKWKKVALELWLSPLASEYDVERGLKMNTSKICRGSIDKVLFPSLVVEELGGMCGDKGMMRYLSKHPRNTLKSSSKTPAGTDSMDIYCDHHVCGNIVYLWCPQTKAGPARAPYGPELQMAFNLVSGVNPRRQDTNDQPSKSQLHHKSAILKAMEFCSRVVRGIKESFPKCDKPVDYGWSIPTGALAGMIGPVEVRVGTKVLVATIDPNNLTRLVIIPRPSRNSDLKDLSDEERKSGLEQAKEVLCSGVKLKWAPHSSLDGLVAKLSCNHDEWMVGGISWNEKRNVVFSITQYPDWNVEYENLPFDSLDEYSQEIRQWVAGRIGGFEPLIHMPTIARDGSGTKESLTGMECYSLLMKLSKKYPDALWPTGSFSFETRCIPLRLEIREHLLASIDTTSVKGSYPEWQDDRELRPLQREALEGMLRADSARMGSFLWMLVGSGKSMTVLSFIHKTRRSTATLWCLPMSAMKSVASEVRRAGWQVCFLASTEGRLKQHSEWASRSEMTLDDNLRPGTITLVEHDDVRNLVATLSPQMLSTTFVYDEVHKAMAAKTQRTASALSLARLAKQVVALTGTPIVDSRAFTLISWLRFCVPFQVHSRNFWVAANSMIAKLASTPVRVDRRTVNVPLSLKQIQDVDMYLPVRLGGTARKPNFEKAYKLSLGYVDDWIIKETIRIVYANRGEAPDGINEGEGHAHAVALTRLLPPSLELFDHLEQRVLLAAADRNHGATLVSKLLAKRVPADDIIFIGGRKRPELLAQEIRHSASVCYTAEEWRRGEWVPKICVAPIAYCEGYSLTWMTTLITGVYPSNQSKRTQMEGRINRANCERLHRTYITAMAGLTEIMFKYQRNAKNLESALANLAKAQD